MDEQLEILATKELNGTTYVLAVEKTGDGGDGEETVIMLRGVGGEGAEGEYMTFEAVGEDAADFVAAVELFAEEFEELGILTE